jgi:hypothetical protein
MGYEPKYFIGSGGTATTNFTDALGDWANGFIAVSYAMPSKGDAFSWWYGQQYIKRYKQVMPSGHALMAGSGVLMLADAMRAAGGTDDPAKVIAASEKLVKKIDTYPNGCGFKLQDHRNTLCPNVAMQWQNQKLIMVWPKKFAVAAIQGPLPLK